MNYKLRVTTPEFFANRSPEAPEVVQAFKDQLFATFPSTPDNYFVIYNALQNNDPKTFHFDHAAKAYMMMAGKRLLVMSHAES